MRSDMYGDCILNCLMLAKSLSYTVLKCMQIKQNGEACGKLDPPINSRNWMSCIKLDHVL